jgi:hypothetical protein
MIPRKEITKAWAQYWKKYHLCLALPDTIEAYLQSVDKDVRTQCNKATRNGLVAKWTTEPQRDDIAAIWHSWSEKQGRPINLTIGHTDPNMGSQTIGSKWPFDYYEHTQGYHDLIQVYTPTGVVVAYLELASDGPESVVFSTLGHKNYLRLGVMKFLFVEAVRGLIDRGSTALYYMKPKYLEQHPESAPFVNDLRFKVAS